MEQAKKHDQLDGCWVPLVKMAKGWNRASGKPIKPSFLVEVMAEGSLESHSQRTLMKYEICSLQWKRISAPPGLTLPALGRPFLTR